MLAIEEIDVFYGDAQALASVSLEADQGEIVAIVGANGAGKTSLIRTIAGMLEPARGRIMFKGAEIGGLDSSRVCNLGVGQVAEGRQVFPSLSVYENLLMGGLLPRARARRAQNLERMIAMFPRLGERMNQAAGTLSGGEQQMLAIARILRTGVKALLLDETPLERTAVGAALDARTEGNRDTPVFLRADRSVDYGALMGVLDALRNAGYLKVALVGLEGAP